MSGSYVSRELSVIITLGEIPATKTTAAVPLYFSGGSKTVELTGHAVEATVSQAGNFSMAQAEITIYNAPRSTVNSVTSYGQPLYYENRNTVALLAGDDQNGMSLAFEGNITEAVADYTQAPNFGFNITAATGFLSAMNPVVATGYRGSISVDFVVSLIAASMGVAFNNEGVGVVIARPYLQGTLLNQLQQICRAANVNYCIDKSGLTIWEKTGARSAASGANPVAISPDSGLVGYPSWTTFGCMFRTLYNANLCYGGVVKLQSSLQPACGEWVVYNMAHLLASQIPDGDWFSDVLVARRGRVPAVT